MNYKEKYNIIFKISKMHKVNIGVSPKTQLQTYTIKHIIS